MAPYFKNYDPGSVHVIVVGIQLQGFSTDSIVKCTRDTESFSDEAGAGGDIVRTRSRDQRGQIVIALQGASPSNDLLSTLLATDEQTGLGFGAAMVKDLRGTTLVKAAACWVQKWPDIEFGAKHTNREWTIRLAQMTVFAGGSLV